MNKLKEMLSFEEEATVGDDLPSDVILFTKADAYWAGLAKKLDEDDKEMDVVNKALTDIETVFLMQEAMDNSIMLGDREGAIRLHSKLKTFIADMSESYEIECIFSEGLEMESLSDMTWLEYQQEEISSNMWKFILRLVGFLSGIIVAALTVINSHKSRKASADNLEKVRKDIISNISYIAPFNWHTKDHCTLKEALHSLESFKTTTLPRIYHHVNILKNTVVSELTLISGLINDGVHNYITNTDLVVTENDIVSRMNKSVSELESVVSSMSGIYLNGFIVAGNNTEKRKILMQYKDYLDPTSYDKCLNKDVANKAFAVFVPYYNVKINDRYRNVHHIRGEDICIEYQISHDELFSYRGRCADINEKIKESNNKITKEVENIFESIKRSLKNIEDTIEKHSTDKVNYTQQQYIRSVHHAMSVTRDCIMGLRLSLMILGAHDYFFLKQLKFK